MVTPIARRQSLLRWAQKGEGRYIIEDDYDSEFRFTGRPIPTLQSIDRSGRVIYMNTFSRTLAPSLRISYMVLPPALLEDYHRRLGFYSCTVPAMEQYTLARFLSGGGFETHVNRMRVFYRGRRDQVLSALSDYYRRESAPLDAIRRAVTYPAVMATLIALVFLVLVSRVLPVFSQVFSQLGAGLSPVAAALLSSGSTGQIIAYILSGLLLAGAGALLLFFRGERGVRLFSRGATVEAVARGRFSSAMALMLQSGLPLDEAMERTSELLEGSPLAERFLDCRRRVSEGASFPCAVEDAGVLTGLQAGLLAAGFRTGVSEEAMAELARRCQAEADERLSRLLSRFEYLLVIVLCAAVGLVLLSVMLPLLGVLSAIGG